ncbi:MAG: sulfite exporter TauE/SafE family protein [Bacteroidota bacterium]
MIFELILNLILEQGQRMETTTALILIVIGLMAGVFGGIFGIGGAIIMIPAMVYFLGVDQHTAQGTSLAVMLPPIGLFAAYNYYKAGQVNIWYAVIIAVSFMIGGYVGSKIALNLPEHIMKKVFGIFLIIMALKLIFSKQAGVPE